MSKRTMSNGIPMASPSDRIGQTYDVSRIPPMDHPSMVGPIAVRLDGRIVTTSDEPANAAMQCETMYRFFAGVWTTTIDDVTLYTAGMGPR